MLSLGLVEILLRVSFEKGTTDANYFVSINTDANVHVPTTLLMNMIRKEVCKGREKNRWYQYRSGTLRRDLSMFNLMVFAN
jgi:hypothetical protein